MIIAIIVLVKKYGLSVNYSASSNFCNQNI